MDILGWLNKLNLEGNLLTYVGEHYFKHLLLVKLMDGSGVNIANVKSCEYSMTATELEVTLKLKKSVNMEDVSETIKDNLNEFTYATVVGSKSITVKILDVSNRGEIYNNGSVVNTYA